MIAFVALLTTMLTADGRLSSDDLARILDASRASIEDVQCEYEGTFTFTSPDVRARPSISPDGVFDSFSGFYAWRGNDALLIEVYHQYSEKSMLERQTISILGNKIEEYKRTYKTPKGMVFKLDRKQLNLKQHGLLTTIFLVDALREMLRKPGMRMIHEGGEVVDGHFCEVIAFAYVRKDNPEPTLKNSSGERFWVDLEHGGHVLKHEDYSYSGNDSHLGGRSTIVLDRFEFGGGKSAWLPVHGVAMAFTNVNDQYKISWSKSPTSIRTISVMKNTVRINVHPGDSLFSVKHELGTPVTDTLRHRQYEFGLQQPPPTETREQVEARFREQLAIADRQKDELKASSWARSGPSWTAWLPWCVSIVACVGVLIVLLRRLPSRLRSFYSRTSK